MPHRAGAGRRSSRGWSRASSRPRCGRPVERILPIRPSGSGNCQGLNSHVLYCVSQGESRTIASSGSRLRAVTVVVLEHVALVRVDVAALPVSVAPLRQYVGEAGQPAVAAQEHPRPRAAQQVQAQRPRGAADRERDVGLQVELDAGTVALDPGAPARRGEQPGDRDVVAHRHAAGLEHVRRAVGPGVAAVGAEVDQPAGLIEAQPMPAAGPGHVFRGVRAASSRRSSEPHRAVRRRSAGAMVRATRRSPWSAARRARRRPAAPGAAPRCARRASR